MSVCIMGVRFDIVVCVLNLFPNNSSLLIEFISHVKHQNEYTHIYCVSMPPIICDLLRSRSEEC